MNRLFRPSDMRPEIERGGLGPISNALEDVPLQTNRLERRGLGTTISPFGPSRRTWRNITIVLRISGHRCTQMNADSKQETHPSSSACICGQNVFFTSSWQATCPVPWSGSLRGSACPHILGQIRSPVGTTCSRSLYQLPLGHSPVLSTSRNPR